MKNAIVFLVVILLILISPLKCDASAWNRVYEDQSLVYYIDAESIEVINSNWTEVWMKAEGDFPIIIGGKTLKYIQIRYRFSKNPAQACNYESIQYYTDGTSYTEKRDENARMCLKIIMEEPSASRDATSYLYK